MAEVKFLTDHTPECLQEAPLDSSVNFLSLQIITITSILFLQRQQFLQHPPDIQNMCPCLTDTGATLLEFLSLCLSEVKFCGHFYRELGVDADKRSEV